MTTKVNLIYEKKNAHSSEKVLRGVGILYMSLATFSMEVAIF